MCKKTPRSIRRSRVSISLVELCGLVALSSIIASPALAAQTGTLAEPSAALLFLLGGLFLYRGNRNGSTGWELSGIAHVRDEGDLTLVSVEARPNSDEFTGVDKISAKADAA